MIQLHDVIFYSLTLCVVVSVLCIFLIMHQKVSRQQQFTLMSGVCILAVMLGYWFLVQADDLSSASVAQKIVYVGTSNIFYFILRFIAIYCDIYIKKIFRVLLLLSNTVIMTLALTFDKHKLFYKNVEYVSTEYGAFLEKESGVGNMLFKVMMAVYVIIILVMSIFNINKRNTSRSYKNTVLLFFVITIPCILYAIEKMSYVKIYLTPYGLAIAEVLTLSLVYRTHIYDFNNTAQAMAYDTIDDAVLAIDDNYKFKGCNNKAKELFPVLRGFSIDDEIHSLDGSLFDIVVNRDMKELCVNRRYYKPEIKNIKNKDKVMGFVVWFYDVTAEREKTDLLENYQKDLEREVELQTQKLRDVQEKVIMGFANIIESRDFVTGGHIKRTSMYIDILIKGLVKDGTYTDILTPSYISHIKLAAPLHDIGKVAVPDSILNKNGRFTYEEFEIMKKHTVLGAQILDDTLSGLDDLEYYHLARELALYHHEKWDGTGYPEGLSNIDIPLCARIMAVVDVFDALVSKRPYKQSYPVSTVYKIIENESGKQFDPLLVRCFLKVRPQVEKVVEEMSD